MGELKKRWLQEAYRYYLLKSTDRQSNLYRSLRALKRIKMFYASLMVWVQGEWVRCPDGLTHGRCWRARYQVPGLKVTSHIASEKKSLKGVNDIFFSESFEMNIEKKEVIMIDKVATRGRPFHHLFLKIFLS